MNGKRSVMMVLGVITIVVTAGCGAQQSSDTPLEQATSSVAVKPTATPSGTPKVLTPENARYLESKLTSSHRTEQGLALVPALREGKWSSSTILPAGATLMIDQKSFSVASNGYATVGTTVGGSVKGKFILHLALVGDQWLVYQTEQRG